MDAGHRKALAEHAEHGAPHRDVANGDVDQVLGQRRQLDRGRALPEQPKRLRPNGLVGVVLRKQAEKIVWTVSGRDDQQVTSHAGIGLAPQSFICLKPTIESHGQDPRREHSLSRSGVTEELLERRRVEGEVAIEFRAHRVHPSSAAPLQSASPTKATPITRIARSTQIGSTRAPCRRRNPTKIT